MDPQKREDDVAGEADDTVSAAPREQTVEDPGDTGSDDISPAPRKRVPETIRDLLGFDE